jgi:para-nitrobenzyl esterase
MEAMRSLQRSAKENCLSTTFMPVHGDQIFSSYVRFSGKSTSSSLVFDVETSAYNSRIMRYVKGSYLYVAAAMLLTSAYAQTNKQMHTDSGDLIGTTSGGVRIFLGVPYATAPIGPLRWQLPQPVVSSSKPLAADKLGPACIQELSRSRLPWTEEFMVQNADSEDCLNVNVWAPATGRAHAVLVFLHGGGFTEGSNGIATYDGTSLAKRGIVVVTVNYRLGMFGFFANSELRKESPDHSAGNYGLADTVAALRWVQRNIAAFGGDPTRVALAGQSAGAAAVVDLLASPQAKGLFQRAIVDSSGVWPASQSTELSATIADGDSWTAAHGGSLAALRALPAEEILKTKDAAADLRRPSVGTPVFPIQPGTAIQTGAGSDVPVIMGWVAGDGVPRSFLSAEQFRADAVKKYGDRSEHFLTLYPVTDDATAKASQLAAAHDRNFAVSSIWAEAWRAHQRSPVYLYYVTRVPSWPAHPEFGMHHTGELPYFFGTLDKTTTRSYDADDRAISEAAQESWVHFAETGNPGAPWKPASTGEGPWTIINKPLTCQQELDAARVAFWREVLLSKP